MSMNSERSKRGRRDQVREPGSIPFLWEEAPGQPKKDYIIQALISDPSPSPEQPGQLEKDHIIQTPAIDPSPAKLVISVPFQWEEEPGKPKTSSPARLNSVLLCSPITSIREEGEEEEDGFEDCDENDDDELFELDFESFAFDENDLPIKRFSRSTPSMLANCMSTLSELSNAIPIEHTISITDYQTSSSLGQEKNSIEDESSYIEFHFPILTPHSGFIRKVFVGENHCSDDSSGQGSARQSCCRIKCIKVKRAPPTIGDLIFTNCAKGKPKKNLAAVHSKSHNSSQDRMVCCAFGTGSGRLLSLKTKQP
ncbi:hypothetical protein EJ110_NYTH16744 [Nymphaea thermarum]|nr:hypothetical protein EJ110_NYTH16744 [Nymphaea thermarum]